VRGGGGGRVLSLLRRMVRQSPRVAAAA
jgi:hypothetical protein